MNDLDGLFARRLREVRQAAGITQYQLAARVSIYQSAVSKVETGDRPASINEAVRFADALGVDLMALVTNDCPDDLIEAQVAVRNLEHKAVEYQIALEEAQILYDHTVARLAQARTQDRRESRHRG